MPCWTAFPASSDPSVGIRMWVYIVLSLVTTVSRRRVQDLTLRAACGSTAIPAGALYLLLGKSFRVLRAYRGQFGKQSAERSLCRWRARRTREHPECLSHRGIPHTPSYTVSRISVPRHRQG